MAEVGKKGKLVEDQIRTWMMGIAKKKENFNASVQSSGNTLLNSLLREGEKMKQDTQAKIGSSIIVFV